MTGEDRPTRAWPVDSLAPAAPVQIVLVIAPDENACTTMGIIDATDAIGPVLVEAGKPVESAAAAARGECRSLGGLPPHPRATAPAGSGCCMGATAVRQLIVATVAGGHPLPHTVTGFAGEDPDAARCRLFADCLGDCTGDHLRLPKNVQHRAAAVPRYARRWLAWVAAGGGARPNRDTAESAEEQRWREVLAALHAAGERAGRDAAEWWAQEAIGGRASGDATVTALAVLTGIDEGDPAVVDALPACDVSGQWVGAPTGADWYRDAAPCTAPDWDDLSDQARDEVIDAYLDGFDTGVLDAVARMCRELLDEPGSDPEPEND